MKIEIERDELIKLYGLFSELNDFFHQEGNFTHGKTNEFVSKYYPTIKEYYYNKLWDMIPKEDQERFLDQ